MRILFLTHSFNSLSQRLFVELTARGHEVSIEFDINDAVAEEAVALFQPALIVAPFLKRAIPESIWRNHLCLIVHPGIKGDRGPSSLDWAILRGETRWGVTCLQADAEMDAGDIWSAVEFEMRDASKGSLYRNEVADAAVTAVLEAIEKLQQGNCQPEPLDYSRDDVRGQWHCLMSQAERCIDWRRDDTATVLRKVRSADGVPGVRDRIGERDYFLYNAHPEGDLSGVPGALLARRDGAICRATIDGAVWITHLRPAVPESGEFGFKLPAVQVLGELAAELPLSELAIDALPQHPTWQEIRYREANGVGYLHFDCYNGAMDSSQCMRLRDAVLYAAQRPVKVLVLMGGCDFWSNGIHLNQIEAADSASDESWRNINAMDDLCQALVENCQQLVIAAMQGNAGAGGVFLALAADEVWARNGVVLNPHYKGMGNLYGSEYWTYLLPKRVGEQQAAALTHNRLPLSARQAADAGLLDLVIEGDSFSFVAAVQARAEALSLSEQIDERLDRKRTTRLHDEQQKPLSAYRAEELEKMKLNFFGFDPSYHVARYHFVEKLPKARTPAYLARHRRVVGAKQRP
ncbi:hydrogenase maturation protein [Motiliproteus sediminis]|uniref:hydrogenase maturation protein n=1 Tax=Motiliproteus sediminis TaxID=1468178 RepID=UPI001AEFA0B4|nr:hydrogenase maturation protein [Motiliproteus sediminis]